jgi:hypothetical protein
VSPLRAALHVHSSYSDGELSLAQLRDLLLSRGCSVACMADHASAFDTAKAQEYVAECQSLSDERFRFVPGLEFDCEPRMHVIGYGVTALADSADPEVVFGHIADKGGVSVIAHPAPEHLGLIPLFRVLPDGIEAWNTKYDGAAAPRPEVFALITRLRTRRADLLAFYGLDLHWRRQPARLYAELQVGSAGEEAVLACLRTGRFTGTCDETRLPSDGVLPDELLAEFGIRNGRSQRVRRLMRRVKRWAGPLGRSLPAPIKSRLRRFL